MLPQTKVLFVLFRAKEKRVSSVPHQSSSNVNAIEGVEVGDAKRVILYY